MGRQHSFVELESNHYLDSYHTFVDVVTETCVSFSDEDHPVTLLDTFDDWEYEDLMDSLLLIQLMTGSHSMFWNQLLGVL